MPALQFFHQLIFSRFSALIKFINKNQIIATTMLPVKNNIQKVLGFCLLLLFLANILALPPTFAGAPAKKSKEKREQLKLFIIGNSFSQNAAKFLPQLAKEGGKELKIGRAELGGCSLQRHCLAAAHFNPPKICCINIGSV